MIVVFGTVCWAINQNYTHQNHFVTLTHHARCVALEVSDVNSFVSKIKIGGRVKIKWEWGDRKDLRVVNSTYSKPLTYCLLKYGWYQKEFHRIQTKSWSLTKEPYSEQVHLHKKLIWSLNKKQLCCFHKKLQLRSQVKWVDRVASLKWSLLSCN